MKRDDGSVERVEGGRRGGARCIEFMRWQRPSRGDGKVAEVGESHVDTASKWWVDLALHISPSSPVVLCLPF